MGADLAEHPVQALRRQAALAAGREIEGLEAEDDLGAFGCFRGVRERADALELRLRSGNRRAFPVASISGYDYDPSRGIRLKVVQGDGTVIIITIMGRHLNGAPGEGNARLFENLLRCRVPWVRECADPGEDSGSGTLITAITIDEREPKW